MGAYLLTGAGSGIGREVALRLHARGDTLWLVARSPERADALAAEFAGAEVVVADLADPGGVPTLGGWPDSLDGVVHAAGVVELGAVADLGERAWREQLAVNLVAPALLTAAVLPAVRAARGTVVFVNSTAGLSAHPQWAAYAASKSGLRSLADALRAEEQPHGVRVTTVFPGRTATPMQESVHAQEGRDYRAEQWIRPATVAETVLHVLDLPGDATIPEVTVRPR